MSKRYNDLDTLSGALSGDDGLIIARDNKLFGGKTPQDVIDLITVDDLPGQNKGIRSTALTTDQFFLADAGKLVQFTAASAITCYVMDYTVLDFPIGTIIDGVQYGTGVVTLTAGGQALLRSNGNKLKSNGQYAAFTLVKLAQNEWLVTGNLTT